MTSNEVDASSLLATSDDDGVAVCYLCLDGGLDEAGQSLRRDCACRGTDAGFVHLSCLAELAASKSMQARDKDMEVIHQSVGILPQLSSKISERA